MKKIQLNIPDTVDLSENELSLFLAIKLYEESKVTLGQAATIIGYTKTAFIEILNKYGISLFTASVKDIQQDLNNA